MKTIAILLLFAGMSPLPQEPARHKVYIAVLNRFVYDKSKVKIIDYQRMSTARFAHTSDSTFTLTVVTPGDIDLKLTTDKGPVMLHCTALELPDAGKEKLDELARQVRVFAPAPNR